MIHCYADDSQLYISFSPNNRAGQLAVMRNMKDHIRDIQFWMSKNDLNDKTEFLFIGTLQQLGKLDNISIHVDDSDIHPVPNTRNLGSWFDSRLSTLTHKLSQKSVPLHFNISIIFVGSESTLHSSQLRLLSMHSQQVTLITAMVFYMDYQIAC